MSGFYQFSNRTVFLSPLIPPDIHAFSSIDSTSVFWKVEWNWSWENTRHAQEGGRTFTPHIGFPKSKCQRFLFPFIFNTINVIFIIFQGNAMLAYYYMMSTKDGRGSYRIETIFILPNDIALTLMQEFPKSILGMSQDY